MSIHLHSNLVQLSQMQTVLEKGKATDALFNRLYNKINDLEADTRVAFSSLTETLKGNILQLKLKPISQFSNLIQTAHRVLLKT